ncbi:MAG: type II secretion system protein [Minisyncoccales bacterium]
MIIKNKQKSFTLIELLVVIVIIGILAGVIMISTSSSIDKANFAKAQAFSSTVQNELLLNLVSEWTFDEPEENGKTKDTWGNNHGTVVGADTSC